MVKVNVILKIISTKLLPYLYELIPPLQRSNRYPGCFQTLHCRSTLFQNSFLLFTIIEWKKFDTDIKNIDFYAIFSKKFLTFIRPPENDKYRIYDPLGVRLLKRLRLGFSRFRKHKFRHNFADTLNQLYSCSFETEHTEHYFLCCQNNLSFHTTLMNNLNNISTAIASLNPNDLLRIILYRDKSFNRETNCKILTGFIKFIKDTH